MKKKPLVIISQEPVFEELEKRLEEGHKAVEEEKMFCEKRIMDSVKKNIYSVWLEVEEAVRKRGHVGEDVIFGREDSCTHGLHIQDGVLFLQEKGQQDANPLSQLLGGLIPPT